MARRTREHAVAPPDPPACLVLFLRGINVGGHNRLSMQTLVELLEQLGCSDVRTYQQSGNAVVRAPAGLDVAATLREALRHAAGVDAEVLARDQSSMTSIAAANPLLAAGLDKDKLHVTFLAAAPVTAEIAVPVAIGADRFVIGEREVFLYCPDGYGRSKLTNTFFERRLQVSATTRNWRTVSELARLVEES